VPGGTNRLGEDGGRTIQIPDALLAGPALAHGAVLVTHNTDDFPIRDLRVEHPDYLDG
jgi:predicted nucleic acid-binding protein